MAFDIKKLIPVGGQSGDGIGVWTYTTTDTALTVDTSGYFNTASDRLKIGDIIDRVTTSSGVPSAAGRHFVLSNASGVVDVSDETSFTLTDLD